MGQRDYTFLLLTGKGYVTYIAQYSLVPTSYRSLVVGNLDVCFQHQAYNWDSIILCICNLYN